MFGPTLVPRFSSSPSTVPVWSQMPRTWRSTMLVFGRGRGPSHHDSQIPLIQLLPLLHKRGPNQGVIGKDSSAFLNCHTLPPGAPGAKDSGNRRAAGWAGRPDNRSATFERSGTTTSGWMRARNGYIVNWFLDFRHVQRNGHATIMG
jgi:hypothetical protein